VPWKGAYPKSPFSRLSEVSFQSLIRSLLSVAYPKSPFSRLSGRKDKKIKTTNCLLTDKRNAVKTSAENLLLQMMLGDLGKHLHQSGAECENGFNMEICAAALIKKDCKL